MRHASPVSSAALARGFVLVVALVAPACAGPTEDAAAESGGTTAAGVETGSAPSTTTPGDASAAEASASTASTAETSTSGTGDEPSDDDGPGHDLPPHTVSPCDGLAAAGTWEDITPPLVELPDAAPCAYGGAFAMNPQDPSTVWLGTCNQGVWKTSDCGASWTHVDTGTNGDVLDAGRQWTFAIDPSDPDVLYTNSGYGVFSNGALKSVDGGVNWSVIWPPAQPELQGVVQYDFVASVVMDPDDPEHLLLTFHAECGAGHSEACFGRSFDGGETWMLVDGEPQWVGGEGQFVYFLDGRETWLWGSQSNGLWRTDDAGATWTAVTDDQAQGHGAGQMYRAVDGTFYLPVLAGILRSPDGITWTAVPDSGSIMSGLTGNGVTMWASRGFPWDPSDDLYEPFWTSAEDDGLTWTQFASPMLSNGGQLAYDADHHLLYSSNGGEGLWRVVVE